MCVRITNIVLLLGNNSQKENAFEKKSKIVKKVKLKMYVQL